MLNILFPDICNGCNGVLRGQESILCTTCRHQLPMASFHKNNNPLMEKLFYGKIPVKKATALLYFMKKSVTQELFHNLKYRKQENISGFLGKWMGAELKETNYFEDVDIIIPVPLHPARKRKRGYNQVSQFGEALSKALHIPFREDILIKIKNTDSQVFKKRFSRFNATDTVASHFKVVFPELLENKHVLLIDDIVTTGATLEACATQLLEVPRTSISFATMAITSS